MHIYRIIFLLWNVESQKKGLTKDWMTKLWTTVDTRFISAMNRRNDNVSEVIDGQQRLLSILGFLQESYKDENGKEQLSNKHGFKLSKLRFLKELNAF